MKLQLCCPTPLDIYQARNIRHKVCPSFLENQCGTWYTANEPKISACMDTVRKAKQRDIEPMEAPVVQEEFPERMDEKHPYAHNFI
ncbi:MAG: hypothetical protein RR426_09230, partial [Oscillospiraceae bacterium]